MIKNLLERRKESDTYLADSRHRWSLQIAMKVDKVHSFQPALWPSSADVRNLRTPAMSTVSSQVGVALFPSF